MVHQCQTIKIKGLAVASNVSESNIEPLVRLKCGLKLRDCEWNGVVFPIGRGRRNKHRAGKLGRGLKPTSAQSVGPNCSSQITIRTDQNHERVGIGGAGRSGCLPVPEDFRQRSMFYTENQIARCTLGVMVVIVRSRGVVSGSPFSSPPLRATWLILNPDVRIRKNASFEIRKAQRPSGCGNTKRYQR